MKKVIYLTAIISFSITLSCNESGSFNPIDNSAEVQKLADERKKLEDERKKLEDEKMAREESERRERVMALKRLEDKFKDSSGIVVVSKTYFHDAPDASTARKAFLVQSDVCYIERTSNGFGYVQFYNYSNGKTTKGWINLRDLEPYELGC